MNLTQIDTLCDSHKKLETYIGREFTTVNFRLANLIIPLVHYFNESSTRVLKVNKTESYASNSNRSENIPSRCAICVDVANVNEGMYRMWMIFACDGELIQLIML